MSSARILAPIVAVTFVACTVQLAPKTDDTGALTSEGGASSGSTEPPGPTDTTTPEATTGTPTTAADTTTDPATDPTATTVETSTTVPPATDTTDTGGDSELCVRVGGVAGLEQLVTLFLGRVLVDTRINAYFLRSDLDWTHLGACVVDQLGAELGCAGVTYDCKDMQTAHAGLGISTADLLDFAEDFALAWDEHAAMNAPDLTPEDKGAVAMTLAGMAPDIVEDMDSAATVYQRVGRKPAIRALIGDPMTPNTFLANLAADFTINGYFDGADYVRLGTCLTRQVHSIDGPDTYGRERDDFPPGVDPGPTAADPCRNMSDAHLDLVDPNDDTAIEYADFSALVTDLINAMNSAGVAPADRDAIVGALAPLCPQIVAVDPGSCP